MLKDLPSAFLPATHMHTLIIGPAPSPQSLPTYTCLFIRTFSYKVPLCYHACNMTPVLPHPVVSVPLSHPPLLLLLFPSPLSSCQSLEHPPSCHISTLCLCPALRLPAVLTCISPPLIHALLHVVWLPSFAATRRSSTAIPSSRSARFSSFLVECTPTPPCRMVCVVKLSCATLLRCVAMS